MFAAHAEKRNEDHWKWRYTMAETMAAELRPDIYGVRGFYLFGSTKNATAGPGSDVDVVLHFDGIEKQKEELLEWLDDWSERLARMNYEKTGLVSDGLLDAHIVTDADVKAGSSYAVKINAISDGAHSLRMGENSKASEEE